MKQKIGLCSVAGLLIGLSQIMGNLLSGRESGSLPDSLLWVVIQGFLWSVGGVLICLALWKFGTWLYTPGKHRTVSPLFYQLCILLCWLPCYIAYFPAIYSYDGEPQLIQYTTHAFDNHHPILHTLILGWCYDLGKFLRQNMGISVDGMAFYAFGQMLLLSGAFAYGIRYLNRRGCKNRLTIAVTAWCGLFPCMRLWRSARQRIPFSPLF